ncbi:GIY-YIG nuclease family protein [Micromonospora sp. BL1]|uniref:GIY-YIG nuclease family protein n=1 Tax=Micromonospora sp. BL1 TaxID=2478709 RepID=UPI000EF5DE04|nr:GIY-YIG nuclease family protein [Micromonospora sp. BL1]
MARIPDPAARPGFVYILINPALSGMVKIGLTVGDPLNRARQLSRHTGVPQDFEVAYEELVSDCGAVEQLLHQRFAEWRVNSRREFFRIPLKDAIVALQQAAEMHPIDATHEEKVDILPQLESRLRRWLRRDLVALHISVVQDIVYLEQIFQPHPTLQDFETKKIDLGFIGDDEDPDELMFNATWPARENARRLLALDTYSLWYCTDLMNEEVEFLFRQAEQRKDYSQIPFAL